MFDKIERRKITRCVRRGETVWACRDLFAHGAGLGGIEGIGQKGGATDYIYVNVRYTPSNGGKPQDLVYDPACSGPGWHFDDAQNPQHILICQASCTVMMADSSAKLDVLFGCPRQEK